MYDLTLLTNSTDKLMKAIGRNSSTILSGIAVATLFGAVAAAIKATPKAVEILYHEAEFRREQWASDTGEHEDSYPDEKMFKPVEIVELTWKEYIPTIVLTTISTACIIGSNHISLRKNAALVSLVTLTESALKEYQEKVKDELGEKKAEKIKSEIAQDHLDQNPVNQKTVIFTGNGNYLCFEEFSKRYFRSDIEKIRQGVNAFNQKLLREGWLGINGFYDEIGLEPIELGDEFGWIAVRDLLDLSLDTKMAKDTNEPCLVIGYKVTPHHI